MSACVYYVTGGKQASVTSQIWHCAVTALHRFPKGKSDLEKHKLCRTTGWILNTEENWFRCVDVYVVLSKTNPHQCVKSKGTSMTCLILALNCVFLKIPRLSNKSANSELSQIIFLNAHILSVCLWRLVCKDSEFDRHCFSIMYHFLGLELSNYKQCRHQTALNSNEFLSYFLLSLFSFSLCISSPYFVQLYSLKCWKLLCCVALVCEWKSGSVWF